MNTAVRQLLLRLSILTLLYATAGVAIKFSGSFSAYYFPAFPFLLIFFAFLYFFFSWSLLKTRHISPKQFINRFILLTSIKFFTLLAIIVFWLLLHRQQSVLFLSYVLALYFGFSLTAYSVILSKKNYDN
jgi:hypothetical protein